MERWRDIADIDTMHTEWGDRNRGVGFRFWGTELGVLSKNHTSKITIKTGLKTPKFLLNLKKLFLKTKSVIQILMF